MAKKETRIIKEKTTEWLKYTFSEEEITEKSKEMAKCTIVAKNLEEQKKAIASDLKGQIDQALLTANMMAKHIQEGHEYRNIDCMKDLDFDKQETIITRVDTGEIITTRKMNAGEKQMTIKGFEETTPSGDLEQGEKF